MLPNRGRSIARSRVSRLSLIVVFLFVLTITLIAASPAQSMRNPYPDIEQPAPLTITQFLPLVMTGP